MSQRSPEKFLCRVSVWFLSQTHLYTKLYAALWTQGTPARNQFPGTPSTSTATPASSPGASTAAAGELTDTRRLLDTAATAAPISAEDASPAPCGTICVALLLQRCSDKSAAVRAKALSNLAAVVHDMLSSRHGSDPTYMLHCRQVSTVHFYLGMAYVHLCCLLGFASGLEMAEALVYSWTFKREAARLQVSGYDQQDNRVCGSREGADD